MEWDTCGPQAVLEAAGGHVRVDRIRRPPRLRQAGLGEPALLRDGSGVTGDPAARRSRHRPRRRTSALGRAGRLRHRDRLWPGGRCHRCPGGGGDLRRQGPAALQSADLPLPRLPRRRSPTSAATPLARAPGGGVLAGAADLGAAAPRRLGGGRPGRRRRLDTLAVQGARASGTRWRCCARPAGRWRRLRPTVPARSARPPRSTCWPGLPAASTPFWTAAPARSGVESTVLDLTGGRPQLLRPGGVTREAIEAVIGPVGAAPPPADPDRPLRSPGQMASHYAPALPVRLRAAGAAPDEALLAFGPAPAGAGVDVPVERAARPRRSGGEAVRRPEGARRRGRQTRAAVHRRHAGPRRRAGARNQRPPAPRGRAALNECRGVRGERPAPPGFLPCRGCFRCPTCSALLATLAARLGPSGLLTDPRDTAPYGEDWRRIYHARPLAVVRPANTAEVAAVVRACAAAGVGVVPQGGNTSLVGGAVPSDDGQQVVVSLRA